MASRRLGWAELNPTYRRRLQSGGITKERYESGGSLSAARGHAATPERPISVKLLPGHKARVASSSAVDDPAGHADYLVSSYNRRFEGETSIVHKGNPTRPVGLGGKYKWVEFRDTDFERAAKYIDAVGNPTYVQVFIQSDGTVVTQIARA